MPTVVVSKRDMASVLIGEYLTENYFEKTDKTFGNYHVFRYKNADLIIIDTEHIYADWLEEKYPSDLYIVASRHSAESGIPCLTVHTTGNWGDAMYGGKSRTLSRAPAQHMLSALRYLKEHPLEGFSVSYEVTHHGPTTETPIMFVEVGSTENEWGNEEAAAVVAEAIIAGLEPEKVPTAIGVGGGHYAPRFTEIALKKSIAFGHMAPRYAFDYLDEYMLRQAVEKTVPRPEYYAMHGVSEEVKETLEEIVEEYGLQRIR
ncbi:MAG: D-aminoacyl-tRNA deacylase [Candidatus Diapherotrites archaeon]|nr:D-aminoacyl-tRNA deacylase [Candidatus Diapherotrites archaeon]MDN5366595.1 D-aminoacyl-tRNA deacylase [Candidatus Diapherotrites archaeon]